MGNTVIGVLKVEQNILFYKSTSQRKPSEAFEE